MTLVLDLPAEIEAELSAAAAAAGTDVTAFLVAAAREKVEGQRYRALFTPPTPAEIKGRAQALDVLGRDIPNRRAEAGLGPLDLTPEADPYGYDERADKQR